MVLYSIQKLKIDYQLIPCLSASNFSFGRFGMRVATTLAKIHRILLHYITSSWDPFRENPCSVRWWIVTESKCWDVTGCSLGNIGNTWARSQLFPVATNYFKVTEILKWFSPMHNLVWERKEKLSDIYQSL